MPRIDKQQVYRQVFERDSKAERGALIMDLEAEMYNPFITIRLSKVQVKILSEYIVLLPYPAFRAICLYHCLGYTHKRIAKTIGQSKIQGLINYCKDRLTQCMGLPRPIGSYYWWLACCKAMDIYDFPE